MEVPTPNRIGLIVVSHPDDASFTVAIARRCEISLQSVGFTTHFCNLYADNFNPVLTRREMRGLGTDDPLVQRYRDLLLSAEVLVVVHPNCWGAPPAMMKGWMDRVFAEGSAYAFEKDSDQGDIPKGLLHTRVAVVFNTSNTEEEREQIVFGDPLERIWKQCLLQYCGVQNVIRHVFRIIATSSVADRERWLDEVSRIVVQAAGS
ncbi:NAD(P)H-dependent oxidoreductase [Terriglobus albidus]|uniref:NAD(P)H-dependent oxidoreductase n=1 Tax=Terriglobus albidus TaxID=1592106 RepID=UPI0021E0C80F|nr:NAD(P)H-dependent oxidoreductase [Terriglobus albidus]